MAYYDGTENMPSVKMYGTRFESTVEAKDKQGKRVEWTGWGVLHPESNKRGDIVPGHMRDEHEVSVAKIMTRMNTFKGTEDYKKDDSGVWAHGLYLEAQNARKITTNASLFRVKTGWGGKDLAFKVYVYPDTSPVITAWHAVIDHNRENPKKKILAAFS